MRAVSPVPGGGCRGCELEGGGGQLELEGRGPGGEESCRAGAALHAATCFCPPAVGLRALLLPCEVEVL